MARPYVYALAAHLLSIPPGDNPLLNPIAMARLPPNTQRAVQAAAPTALAVAGSTSPSSATVAPGPSGDHSTGITMVAQGAASPATTVDPNTLSMLSRRAAGIPQPGQGQDPRLGSSSPAGGGWTPSFPNAGFPGWENRAVVNPIASLPRKKYPIHFCPASLASGTGGAGTMVFTPQEDFQPFRLIFIAQSATSDAQTGVTGADGYITNIIVGTRVVGVNAGSVPMEMFSQYADTGRIDFPFCPATEQFQVALTGLTASTTYYGLLLGYAPNCSDQSEGQDMGRARMGYCVFGSGSTPASLAPGASVTLSAVVQERFKLRRLLVAQNIAPASSVNNTLITQIQIATRVQGSAQGSHPTLAWTEIGQDEWVDFDACPRNSTIAITVQNGNATASTSVPVLAAIGDVWYADEERNGACAVGC